MGLNVGPQQWWLDRYGSPQRSLRFNSSDSAYLSRTPASAGNRKTWTWAGWVKRSALGATQRIFDAYSGNTDSGTFTFRFESADTIRVRFYSNTNAYSSSALFRDASAWYHFVLTVDTTQATASDRIKLYVNGVVATQASGTAPSQNADLAVNDSAALHTIGTSASSLGNASLNGYLADVHFIDGQALDPTSFGEFDSNGIWQPIGYTGTYGTNGFHLPFNDNSTAAALGTDTSGNGNDWSVNNISVDDGSGTVYSTQMSIGNGVGTIPAVNAKRAFDGNIGTLASGDTNSSQPRWTPSSPIPSGSIIRCYINTGNSTGRISDSTGILASGTSGTGGAGSKRADITFTAPRDIDYLQFSLADNGFGGVALIAIDGVTLLDSNAANNDSLVDVPTNGTETDTGVGGEVRGNYATWNPLFDTYATNSNTTWANGNLEASATTRNWTVSSVGFNSGKWYAEFSLSAFSSGSPTGGVLFGVSEVTVAATANPGPARSSDSNGYSSLGNIFNNNSFSSGFATFGVGDIIGVAVDITSNTVDYYKNGSLVSSRSHTFDTSKTYVFGTAHEANVATSTIVANFGQRPFTHQAPSGFKALCTANLPSTTITTSGSFTGNSSTDGPFIYLNGIPTAMTINSNSVTFGTHADKLSNGFKVRDSTSSYNQSGSNTYSITSTGDAFKNARAQINP